MSNHLYSNEEDQIKKELDGFEIPVDKNALWSKLEGHIPQKERSKMLLWPIVGLAGFFLIANFVLGAYYFKAQNKVKALENQLNETVQALTSCRSHSQIQKEDNTSVLPTSTLDRTIQPQRKLSKSKYIGSPQTNDSVIKTIFAQEKNNVAFFEKEGETKSMKELVDPLPVLPNIPFSLPISNNDINVPFDYRNGHKPQQSKDLAIFGELCLGQSFSKSNFPLKDNAHALKSIRDLEAYGVSVGMQKKLTNKIAVGCRLAFDQTNSAAEYSKISSEKTLIQDTNLIIIGPDGANASFVGNLGATKLTKTKGEKIMSERMFSIIPELSYLLISKNNWSMSTKLGLGLPLTLATKGMVVDDEGNITSFNYSDKAGIKVSSILHLSLRADYQWNRDIRCNVGINYSSYKSEIQWNNVANSYQKQLIRLSTGVHWYIH